MTPLIAVAHGSRDPRSAATVSAAIAAIRAARPDLDVRLCFLDLNAPSVDQVIDSVAADGYRAAVVVPLLLGSAFHARVDLPGLLAATQARHPNMALEQADVLGADDRLLAVVRHRIAETGADNRDRLGIALAAVGSSSEAANIRTRAIARRLTAGTRWDAVTCFATSAQPSVAQAISTLQFRGAHRIVVAPWFLAPGLLTDRVIDAAPHVEHAATIGAHPLLVDVVLDRYSAAVARTEQIRLSA